MNAGAQRVAKPSEPRSMQIVKLLGDPRLEGQSYSSMSWQFSPGGQRFGGISSARGVEIWQVQPLLQLGHIGEDQFSRDEEGGLGVTYLKFDQQGNLHISTDNGSIKARNRHMRGIARYGRIDPSDPTRLSVLSTTHGAPRYDSSGRFAFVGKRSDAAEWGISLAPADTNLPFQLSENAELLVYDLQNRRPVCDLYNSFVQGTLDRYTKPLSVGIWVVGTVPIYYHELGSKEPGLLACNTTTGKRYFMPQPVRTGVVERVDPAGRWLYVETFLPKRFLSAARREAYFFELPLNDADFLPTEPFPGYALAVGWPKKPLSQGIFMPNWPYVISADGLAVVSMQKPGQLSFLRTPDLKETHSLSLPGVEEVIKFHQSANGRWLVVEGNGSKLFRVDLKNPTEPAIEVLPLPTLANLLTIVDISDDGVHWIIEKRTERTMLIRLVP